MISFKRKKERNNRDKSDEIVWSLTRTTGPHSERERERELLHHYSGGRKREMMATFINLVSHMDFHKSQYTFATHGMEYYY
jgi:hypothetical protein